MKRIFAAIKFQPDEVLTTLHYNLKNTFRNERINWVKLHNLHLTLKFFGETEEVKIPAIHGALEEVTKKHSSFPLKFSKVGIFGSKYKPRVIWLGIDENHELLALEKDIIDKMNEIGFASDRQNFVPHLTLGRIKFVENKTRFFDQFQQFKTINCKPEKVTEIHLIESKLHSQGPEYFGLQSYSLA